jgi:hypothetical protein
MNELTKKGKKPTNLLDQLKEVITRRSVTAAAALSSSSISLGFVSGLGYNKPNINEPKHQFFSIEHYSQSDILILATLTLILVLSWSNVFIKAKESENSNNQ